jgi:hypothetical protein
MKRPAGIYVRSGAIDMPLLIQVYCRLTRHKSGFNPVVSGNVAVVFRLKLVALVLLSRARHPIPVESWSTARLTLTPL